MEIKFKKITKDKEKRHKIDYHIIDSKEGSVIKSTITLYIEDTSILPSDSLEKIIEKCSEIAKNKYLKR